LSYGRHAPCGPEAAKATQIEERDDMRKQGGETPGFGLPSQLKFNYCAAT
jgi:hypothetical protein